MKTGDDLIVTGGSVTANNVSDFIADGDTTNAGTVIINSNSSASTVNMTLSDAGAYTLNGGNGIDNLTGGKGDDTIKGGNSNDSLSGGDGIDIINGEAGDDTLSVVQEMILS